MLTILCTVLVILFFIAILKGVSTAYFKVGYYEQKLKNHRSKFSDEEWAHIEKVMKMW